MAVEHTNYKRHLEKVAIPSAFAAVALIVASHIGQIEASSSNTVCYTPSGFERIDAHWINGLEEALNQINASLGEADGKYTAVETGAQTTPCLATLVIKPYTINYYDFCGDSEDLVIACFDPNTNIIYTGGNPALHNSVPVNPNYSIIIMHELGHAKEQPDNTRYDLMNFRVIHLDPSVVTPERIREIFGNYD